MLISPSLVAGKRGRTRPESSWCAVRKECLQARARVTLGSDFTLSCHPENTTDRGKGQAVSIAEYAALIWRSWITLVVGVFIGLGAGSTYALVHEPTYQASAQAFISISYAGSVTDLNQGALVAQQVVASYADIGTTTYVLEPVARELGVGGSLQRLASRITVSAPADTAVLQVTAQAQSPTEAALLANAVTKRLTVAVSTLSPSGSGARVRLVQVQRAVPPSAPSSAPWFSIVIVGGILGALGALLVIVIRYVLDSKVRTSTEIERIVRAPVVGDLRRHSQFSSRDAVIDVNAHSEPAESIRALRTNLLFLEPDRQSVRMMVTSANDGEGKTTVVANLAAAMSAAGLATLVIDADLRRPSLQRKFGLESSVGLSDVLIGSVTFDDAVETWEPTGLKILAAGSLPPNPQELLQSHKMAALIEEVSAAYSHILVDTPPLGPVADAAVAGQLLDGCLLVCSPTRSSRTQLQKVIDLLSRTNVKVEGAVANFTTRPEASNYYT